MVAVAIKQVAIAMAAVIATVVVIAMVVVAEVAMPATPATLVLAAMDSKIKVSDQWAPEVMVVLLNRDRAAVALTLKIEQCLLATLALTLKSRISAKFSVRRE